MRLRLGAGTYFPPLPIHEKQWLADGGRYGDSTEDYAWTEMSTGDWDWATSAMASGAQGAIKTILQTSSSVEEAQQRVHQYFVDHGISNGAQVYNANAVWGPDADVVVTGHRPPLPPIYDFDLMGGYSNWCGGASGQTPPPPNPDPVPDNNPDGPDVTVEILHPENAANVYIAADLLKAEIEFLDAKFHNLSDTALIYMKNGEVITGAQLKSWWDNLDFRVTDRDFTVGSGYVANGISNISWTAVAGWNAWDESGLAFIILHELTHSSPGGVLSNAASWDIHQVLGGTTVDYNQNSFWFDANEEYANWGARAIMDLLGLPIPRDIPPFGYDNTLPSLAPPPSGGGGGGSGGGGTGGGGGGGNVGE